MTLNFTLNQLVKFLYRETSRSESLDIQEALCGDAELRDSYEELESAYRQLPKVKFNASKSTLQSILGYSKHSEVENQA